MQAPIVTLRRAPKARLEVLTHRSFEARAAGAGTSGRRRSQRFPSTWVQTAIMLTNRARDARAAAS